MTDTSLLLFPYSRGQEPGGQLGVRKLPQLGQLNKVHAEAKDNVKFLNTLERQFKIIQAGDLGKIEETLASLMNGLKLVSTISRHYKDEKLLNLMVCIANEIAEKVESQIQPAQIFK